MGQMYSGWREDGFPTLYGPLKTAVTADVLEAGFYYALVILGISLLVALPGVKGSKEKFYSLIRILISIFVLASIFLCNFGQEWEVSEIHSLTQYRAGLRGEINATIGAKIGLRSVNITLKGYPDAEKILDHGRVIERVEYNERFSWDDPGFHLGRAGFGPLAGRFNREYRYHQRRGAPYPILWIAEYFTIDGEGIRWGRHYLQAGFYTHILMWLAFPLWIISLILFQMVLLYGGLFTIMTGGTLLLGNVLWATIRNANELKIPFAEDIMEFHWGWCFWLCMINGLLCVFMGVIVVALDYFNPEELARFFGHDTAAELESFYVDQAELDKLRRRKSPLERIFSGRKTNYHAGEDESYRSTGNGQAAADPEAPEDTYDTVPTPQPVVQRMYRKQTILGPRIVSKHPLKAPMPVPRTHQRRPAEDDADGDYVNAPVQQRHQHAHVNPSFDDIQDQ